MLRIALAVVCLLFPSGLYAFDVSYGTLFRVKNVAHKKERLVLPLTNKKYANVRILDKDTFAFVNTCRENCSLPAGEGKIQLSSLRKSVSRENMWIGEVDIDGKWLLTFLVFHDSKHTGIITPSPVVFTDEGWLEQIKRVLEQGIKNEVSS